MRTTTKTLGVLAAAILATAGCREREESAGERWAEQPRETSGQAVTGKKITRTSCVEGQTASADGTCTAQE
jgi:hypothetical protein